MGKCRGCLFSSLPWLEVSYLQYSTVNYYIFFFFGCAEHVRNSQVWTENSTWVCLALPGSMQHLSTPPNLAALCPSELRTWISQFSEDLWDCGLPKCQLAKSECFCVLFILCTSWKPVHLASSYHYLIQQKYNVENPLCWKSWFDLTGRIALGFNTLKL